MGLSTSPDLSTLPFNNCEFLKYPELRSLVYTTMKNPKQKISLNLGEIVDADLTREKKKQSFFDRNASLVSEAP